jgi:hypothetical protein
VAFTDYNYSSGLAALGQGLGNISKGFEQQYQQKRIADLGQRAQNGDYAGAAQAAFAAGDAATGLGLLKLGQTQKQESDWLKANGSILGTGETAAPPAPVTLGSPTPSLINNESGGNWQAQNSAVGAGGQVGHFGRLQFGQARLQEAQAAGAIPPGTTPQQFMQSPEIQKRAEQWHFNDIDQSIKQNGFDRLIGQSINGVPITVEGMRAVAHLGGKDGLRKFIETQGAYNPADANGTRPKRLFRAPWRRRRWRPDPDGAAEPTGRAGRRERG